MLTELVISNPRCLLIGTWIQDGEKLQCFSMNHWVELYGGNKFPLIIKVLHVAKLFVQLSGRLDKAAGRESIQTIELSSTSSQNDVSD